MLLQDGYVSFQYLPDEFGHDAEVLVDEQVAEGDDLGPLDARVSGLKLGRQAVGGLAQHFELPDGGVQNQRAIGKGLQVDFPGIVADLFDRVQHMLNPELITQPVFHR